jgi:hypothetical protein
MKRVTALLLAALVLAGCSATIQPSVSGPMEAAGPAASVPSIVVDRTPLPSCGTENATTQRGPWNSTARTCFWSAYEAGTPAEFISTRLTIEGDAVMTIYRVLAAHRVELFVDSTKDRYGFPGWTRLRCSSLSLAAVDDPRPDFGPDNSCVQSRL